MSMLRFLAMGEDSQPVELVDFGADACTTPIFSSENISVTLSGVQPGDLLIAICAVLDQRVMRDIDASNWPGFTQRFGNSFTWVGTKVADGTESSYTLNIRTAAFFTPGRAAMAVWCYRNATYVDVNADIDDGATNFSVPAFESGSLSAPGTVVQLGMSSSSGAISGDFTGWTGEQGVSIDGVDLLAVRKDFPAGANTGEVFSGAGSMAGVLIR